MPMLWDYSFYSNESLELNGSQIFARSGIPIHFFSLILNRWSLKCKTIVLLMQKYQPPSAFFKQPCAIYPAQAASPLWRKRLLSECSESIHVSKWLGMVGNCFQKMLWLSITNLILSEAHFKINFDWESLLLQFQIVFLHKNILKS